MRGLCSPFGLHTSNMQSIWTAYFKYAVHLDMYVNYEIMYDSHLPAAKAVDREFYNICIYRNGKLLVLPLRHLFLFLPLFPLLLLFLFLFLLLQMFFGPDPGSGLASRAPRVAFLIKFFLKNQYFGLDPGSGLSGRAQIAQSSKVAWPMANPLPTISSVGPSSAHWFHKTENPPKWDRVERISDSFYVVFERPILLRTVRFRRRKKWTARRRIGGFFFTQIAARIVRFFSGQI